MKFSTFKAFIIHKSYEKEKAFWPSCCMKTLNSWCKWKDLGTLQLLKWTLFQLSLTTGNAMPSGRGCLFVLILPNNNDQRANRTAILYFANKGRTASTALHAIENYESLSIQRHFYACFIIKWYAQFMVLYWWLGKPNFSMTVILLLVSYIVWIWHETGIRGEMHSFEKEQKSIITSCFIY